MAGIEVTRRGRWGGGGMSFRGATRWAVSTATPPHGPRAPRWLVAVVALLLLVLAVFIVIRLVSDVPHLLAGTVPEDAYDRRYVQYPRVAYLHIITGALFLAGALLQVSYRWRRRDYLAHRRRGRVLVALGVVASASAIAFGVPHAFGGSGEAVATVVFAGWMAICLVVGVAAARRHDLATHRRWMIRAFAVATAVGTIRIWVGLLTAPGWVTLRDSFTPAFWLAFLIHVVAAEIWIRRTTPPPDAVGTPSTGRIPPRSAQVGRGRTPS